MELPYKNPPEERRFKPGKSGNPKGRPKGYNPKKKISDILESHLNKEITIFENGISTRVSIREAIVKRIMKSASEGNSLALRIFMDHISEQNNQDILYVLTTERGIFSTENFDEVLEEFDLANESRRKDGLRELDFMEVMEAYRPKLDT